MEKFPPKGRTINDRKFLKLHSFPGEGLFSIREKILAVIIWWNLTKLFFVKSKNQTHAGTIKKHHQILPKKLNLKISQEKTTTKNSDLIQARKHVCSQNWTLQRFWIDPHGSSSNPEQRLEIYGLFTDVVVVAVFCASNIHGLSTPRHQILVCGKTRATILPRDLSRNTHKHIFEFPVLGRNERESESDFDANKK